MATIEESVNRVFKKDPITTVHTPNIPWGLVYYNEKRDDDLYKDYEKTGGIWFNKTDPFKYLSDEEMAVKRTALGYIHEDKLEALQKAKQSLLAARLYIADVNEDVLTFEKLRRREKLIEEADKAGQEAVVNFQKNKMASYVTDPNDEDYRPYINDWKEAKDVRANAINDYIYKYMQDNPETDGVPLFDDDIYQTILDNTLDDKLNLEKGVTLSIIVPAAMLPVAIGGFGLNTLSNLGKTYMAANYPTVYAATLIGSGAFLTKWAYDGAKGIYERFPKLYKNIITNNWGEANSDALSMGLDGALVLGGFRGKRLIDLGTNAAGLLAKAKLLDKVANFRKKYTKELAGKVLEGSSITWTDKTKKYLKDFNIKDLNRADGGKYRPMLVNLGLSAGIVTYNNNNSGVDYTQLYKTGGKYKFKK